MNRARLLTITLRAAPIIGGIAAGTAAVTALIAHDWMTATWATIAAAWAFIHAAHSCPTPPAPAPPAPEAVERGAQLLSFVGGPQDGGKGATILPADRDLLHSTVTLDGADYHVAAVEHTCYRAEHAPEGEG